MRFSGCTQKRRNAGAPRQSGIELLSRCSRSRYCNRCRSRYCSRCCNRWCSCSYCHFCCSFRGRSDSCYSRIRHSRASSPAHGGSRCCHYCSSYCSRSTDRRSRHSFHRLTDRGRCKRDSACSIHCSRQGTNCRRLRVRRHCCGRCRRSLHMRAGNRCSRSCAEDCGFRGHCSRRRNGYVNSSS